MRTGNIPTRKLARERRQTEAVERQAIYDALSDAEKAKINPRRYPSKSKGLFDAQAAHDAMETT